jgi:hypothetical protein
MGGLFQEPVQMFGITDEYVGEKTTVTQQAQESIPQRLRLRKSPEERIPGSGGIGKALQVQNGPVWQRCSRQP